MSLKKNTSLLLCCKKLYHRLRLELTPYGYLRNFVLFPIQGYFRSKKIFISSYSENLEKYHNKYKGSRCFIISTGPSLTLDDVLLIKNEYTFSMNTIFKLYEKTDWRPTFYSLLDPNLYKKLLKEKQLENLSDYAKEACFFNSVSKKQLENNQKNILINYCWLDHIYNFATSDKFNYSDDLLYGMYDFYSSTQAIIILAMYMGFSKIYLLGADNNYLGNNQHFAETKGEVIMEESQAYKNQIANDKGYNEVARISKEKGVEIYNATRGGNVKAFPRVKLEEIL